MNNNIRILQKLVSRRGSSKILSFGEPQVLKALQLLKNDGYVSRKSFCKHLHMGEGAVKTLIHHLKEDGFVESVRAGTFLTKKGKNFVNEFFLALPKECFIPNSKFSQKRDNYAILLRNLSDRIKTGIEQRDAAILYGASSTMTMIFKKGKFVFPGEESDCLKHDLKTRKILVENLAPVDNDVIILASADDPFTAELAAKNSALYTLNK